MMRLHGLLLTAACLAGCFTEVGNAEDDRLVEARFRVDYAQPATARPKSGASQTASIRVFYLSVREAEFHLLDSAKGERAEYHLWKEDSAAYPVDFTGRDPSAVLPAQKVAGIDPLDMRLECALPAPKALRADTLDFARFADPGFIKGVAFDGRDSTAFLFALPAGHELRLVYPKATIAAWYRDGRYACEYVFYANRWIAAADLSTAQAAKDATGRKVVLLDADHNADLHSALTTAFASAFNAAEVSIEP